MQYYDLLVQDSISTCQTVPTVVGDVAPTQAHFCIFSGSVLIYALSDSHPPAHTQIHRYSIFLFNNPEEILVNLSPLSRKRYRLSIPKNFLNAARAYIPNMWKQQPPLAVTQWLARMNNIKCM